MIKLKVMAMVFGLASLVWMLTWPTWVRLVVVVLMHIPVVVVGIDADLSGRRRLHPGDAPTVWGVEDATVSIVVGLWAGVTIAIAVAFLA
ncbi:MAG: hypothetical protein U5R31_02970 [Acidimicrobiia bacterium]|nr:hypothetical protein [Acidimicrobiia bacterium]